MGKSEFAKTVIREGITKNGDIHVLAAMKRYLNSGLFQEILVDNKVPMKTKVGPVQEVEKSTPVQVDDQIMNSIDSATLELITKTKGMIQHSTGVDTVDQLIAVGYLHVNNQKFDVGIKIFTDLLAYDSKLVAGYLGRGTAYALMGLFDPALRDFSTAIEIDPKCVDAYKRRGQTRVAKKDFKGGLEDMNMAVEFHKDFDSYHQRGLVYFNMRNFIRALDDFAVALRYDHSHVQTYNQMGLCYNVRGMNAMAVEAYEKAISIDPNYKDALCNLGQTYKEWGKFEKSLESFERALALDNNFAHAHHLKGLLFMNKGRHLEALESLNRAVENDPTHFEAHWMRAVVKGSLGVTTESVIDFEAALQLSPDHFCWYQKEIGIFFHHHLDVPLNSYNIDHELDPMLKEWWCKRLPPSTLPTKIRQPPLNPNIPDIDYNTVLNNEARILVKYAWDIGLMIVQDAPGFLLNDRQVKMAGLAAIEIAQRFHDFKKGKIICGFAASSSPVRKPHTLGWRDIFDITARWRQYSEPNDPVWWVDRLTTKQFTEGFGSHTPMLSGQTNVVRYAPMFDRAFEIMKKLTLEQCSVPSEAREKIMSATTCKDLYNVMKRDYWVVTPCYSTAVKNKILEGTRLTLQLHPPEGYEFSIRTPGTPPRWIDYEKEFNYLFDQLLEEFAKDTYDLEVVSTIILSITFYWYNCMPLSRGSAATGYVALLGMFLAFGIQITAPIPKGELIDWDGILLPEPRLLIEKFSKWLYPGRTPVDKTFFENLPKVEEEFDTLRKLILGLSLPFE